MVAEHFDRLSVSLVEVQLLRNHSESDVSGYRVFCPGKMYQDNR